MVVAGLLTAGVLGAAAPASAAGAFRNPIAPVLTPGAEGADSADPWIRTHRGRYVMTYTRQRRVEVRVARQLGALATARRVQIWPRPGVREPRSRCCQFWAPELHRLRGPEGVRWYVYYSVAAGDDLAFHHMHVLESAGDSPLGPYRHRGRLDLGGQWAIDATVASVRGRLHLFYSGRAQRGQIAQQLYAARLENPWTVRGRPVRIAATTYPWERVLQPITEAPEVLQRDGRVHLVYSASWCLSDAYKLGRMTVPASADLLDPATWARAKAPEPVLRTSEAAGVWGPGHNGFFRSPDGREDWIVYHATDRPGQTCFGGEPRTARAQRIRWRADGTPDFGAPVATARDLRPPSGDATLALQGEDARVEAGAALRSAVLQGTSYVGERALELTGPPDGAQVALSLRAPPGTAARGRLRALGRVETGPLAGTLRAAGGRRHDLRRAGPLRAREVDLGLVRAGRSGRVRMTLRTGGRVVLDQLRLVAP